VSCDAARSMPLALEWCASAYPAQMQLLRRLQALQRPVDAFQQLVRRDTAVMTALPVECQAHGVSGAADAAAETAAGWTHFNSW
jgi:hypothetical protein